MNKQQRQAIFIDQLKDTIEDLLSLLNDFDISEGEGEVANARKMLKHTCDAGRTLKGNK